MRNTVAGLAAAALVIAGCSSDSTPAGFDLSEFDVDGPSSLPEGAQTIQVTNSGEFPHTLVVTDRDGNVVAGTDLLQPGEMTSIDLDVDQGRYQFTCRIVTEIEGGEIIDHFQEGMNTTVDVG